MFIRLLNSLRSITTRLTTGSDAVARVGIKRMSDWLLPVRQLIPIQIMHGYGRACLVSLMLLMPALVQAVPAGTVINNTAQADYSLGAIPQTVSSNVVSTTTVTIRTDGVVELLQYAAGATTTETLSITDYSTTGSTAGPFASLAAPVAFGETTPIDLSQPVPVVPVTIYHQGEPIIVRLSDGDQNQDASLAETVLVTITTSSGDTVILRLTETGPSTGVFTGYIPSQGGSVTTVNDGVLNLVVDDTITADYVDVVDGSDTSTDSVLVDPYGVVFDSVTGQRVDGAVVTLVDLATGLPAQIFGDDGVSTYPPTIVSGSSAVVDSSGTVYIMPPGGYRFPLVAPGNYRLDIVPPSGYSSPSAVATADLQLLPGAPYAIEPGSRGENFVVNPGPALHIDIPLDPGTSGLVIQKATTSTNVSIGDVMSYSISVQNNGSRSNRCHC